MATTKKITKTTGKRKGGKRYMKKAARRTLAALLMITALIVAAIPATPSAATDGGRTVETIANLPSTVSWDAVNARYYFRRVSNAGIEGQDFQDDDQLVFIGFTSLNADGTPAEATTPTSIRFDSTIPIERKTLKVDEDGNPIPDEEGHMQYDIRIYNLKCTAIDEYVVNFDKVTDFECPTVSDVKKGFSESPSLTSFIGDGVTNIDNGAFKKCTGLTEVSVGDGLEDGQTIAVGNNAFEGCSKLRTYAGTKTTSIGNEAFIGCAALETCYVSSSVKKIGNKAFDSDSNLSDFTSPIYVEGGDTGGIGDYAFKGTAITSMTIDGPTTDNSAPLAKGIFQNCTSLDSVDFTGNFRELGEDTFNGCSNLTHVGLADTMKKIGDNAFTGCGLLNNLSMPGQITGGNLPDGLLQDCKMLTTLILNNGGWTETGHSLNLKIDNIFDETWLKSDSCNLVVEGYRYYQPETGDHYKSEAYNYCIKMKVPYKCKDAEGGWADDFFDVDKDGKLLYVNVNDYFNESGFSILGHIDVPDRIQDVPINTITTGAFRDINNNVKSISVNSASIKVEAGAFNYNGIIYVRFADGSQTEIVDSSGVFPSDNFYIYGDVENDDRESLNALEYATKYNVEYRGNGTYDESSLPVTVVVKPVNSSLTGKSKATLVGLMLKGDPKPAPASYDVYETAHSSLANKNANVWLPSGITSIDDNVFKADTYLRKLRADGLTELKSNQFQNSGVSDEESKVEISIDGNFSLGTFGKYGEDEKKNGIYERVFRGATINKLSINDKSGIYSVDEQGVIYENNGGNRTIVEAIENAVDTNGSSGFTPKSDVISLRPQAFENNRWLANFTTNASSTSDTSNITMIPKKAFYNATNLRFVTLGSGIQGVQNDAFSYGDGKNMSNPDMSLYVWDKDVGYTQAFANVDPSLFTYKFYSHKNDTTYKMCEVLKPNSKDNLEWVDEISAGITKTLDNCEILYPKGDTRPYSSSEYNFKYGTIVNTSKEDCDDIVVWDNDANSALDPKFYILSGTITGISGQKNENTPVNFSIYGNPDEGYSASSFLPGKITILSEGGGGGITPSGRFEVTWKYNGPTRSGATVYNPNNDFQYWNEGVPAVEKLFDTKYKKEVVPQDSDSITSNHYFIEKYGVVSPGLGDNTGYGYFHIMDTGGEEHWEEIPYNIRKDIGTNTAPDGSKSIIIGTKESGISGNSIYAKFILKDKGVTLNEGEEYEVGMIERVSDKKGRARLFGRSPKYTGTYVYEFPIPVDPSSSSSSHGGSSTTTSSSSGGGTSSSSSSSGSSSSSSKSSSSKSSSKGGSSSSSRSSSGSSSSSGSGNKNSGTTIVNRNYYGKNGGTADELEEMLRAAHIDSINGGTADGYQVNITKSDAAEASFREALLRRYGSLDNIRYFSMDIDVKDENGNDIDTTGMTVTLTLPLPSSMEQYGTNNQVATVDSAGDLEDLNVQFSTLEGRPCATFVCPHFSPYGFYVNTSDLAIGTLDNTPKTGDPIPLKWFVSFGLAAFSIFLFLKKDPKPQANPA